MDKVWLKTPSWAYVDVEFTLYTVVKYRTEWRRLSLAGCKPRIIPEICWNCFHFSQYNIISTQRKRVMHHKNDTDEHGILDSTFHLISHLLRNLIPIPYSKLNKSNAV